MVRCDGVLICLSCGVVTPMDGQDGMNGVTCARRLDWMSAIYVSGLTAMHVRDEEAALRNKVAAQGCPGGL